MSQNSKKRQKMAVKLVNKTKNGYKCLNINICNHFFIIKLHFSQLLIFLITIHQQNLNKLAEALITIYLISKQSTAYFPSLQNNPHLLMSFSNYINSCRHSNHNH